MTAVPENIKRKTKKSLRGFVRKSSSSGRSSCGIAQSCCRSHCFGQDHRELSGPSRRATCRRQHSWNGLTDRWRKRSSWIIPRPRFTVRRIRPQGVVSPGLVLIGTDARCVAVSVSSPDPIVLANGNCTALYLQQDGTAWLSTNRLYRHERSGWFSWSPGQGGTISASVIAEDHQGNVWVRTSTGLWRSLDLLREHRFSGERAWVKAIVSDPAGGVVAGLENGEIWRVGRDLEAKRIGDLTGLLVTSKMRAGELAWRRSFVARRGRNGASLYKGGAARTEKLNCISSWDVTLKNVTISNRL